MAIGWMLIGALIGALAGQVKKLNILGCVIGGALLGPLAFLIFLCSDNKKTCPYCAERIQKKATVCPHCKMNL